jgi:hypothetical protein
MTVAGRRVNYEKYVGTSANISYVEFYVVTPYSFVGGYEHFGRISCLHLYFYHEDGVVGSPETSNNCLLTHTM